MGRRVGERRVILRVVHPKGAHMTNSPPSVRTARLRHLPYPHRRRPWSFTKGPV